MGLVPYPEALTLEGRQMVETWGQEGLNELGLLWSWNDSTG